MMDVEHNGTTIAGKNVYLLVSCNADGLLDYRCGIETFGGGTTLTASWCRRGVCKGAKDTREEILKELENRLRAPREIRAFLDSFELLKDQGSVPSSSAVDRLYWEHTHRSEFHVGDLVYKPGGLSPDGHFLDSGFGVITSSEVVAHQGTVYTLAYRPFGCGWSGTADEFRYADDSRSSTLEKIGRAIKAGLPEDMASSMAIRYDLPTGQVVVTLPFEATLKYALQHEKENANA